MTELGRYSPSKQHYWELKANSYSKIHIMLPPLTLSQRRPNSIELHHWLYRIIKSKQKEEEEKKILSSPRGWREDNESQRKWASGAFRRVSEPCGRSWHWKARSKVSSPPLQAAGSREKIEAGNGEEALSRPRSLLPLILLRLLPIDSAPYS